MKIFTACSIFLSGAVAVVSQGAVAAGACESLVHVGACIFASALPEEPNSPIARLSGVEGIVMASDAQGFSPVRSDIPLLIGDRVVIADGGKAKLRAGKSFDQDIVAPAVLNATILDGCGCISVQSGVRVFAQRSLENQGDPRTEAQPLTKLQLGALGAVAVGTVAVTAAIVSNNDSDQASSP